MISDILAPIQLKVCQFLTCFHPETTINRLLMNRKQKIQLVIHSFFHFGANKSSHHQRHIKLVLSCNNNNKGTLQITKKRISFSFNVSTSHRRAIKPTRVLRVVSDFKGKQSKTKYHVVNYGICGAIVLKSTIHKFSRFCVNLFPKWHINYFGLLLLAIWLVLFYVYYLIVSQYFISFPKCFCVRCVWVLF